MTATVADWVKDLEVRPAASIDRSIQVVGLRDKHLGPRWEHARIDIVAEPADAWSVVVEIEQEGDGAAEREALLRQALFGLLDVLVTRPPQPLLNLRVRVVGAEFDPVQANARAFRLAGRDAGEKLLEALGLR